MTAWLFLLPSIAGTVLFVLLPFADVVRRSFLNAVGREFVGLDNYRAVFLNQAFWQAFLHTVRFLTVCIPLLLILSFGMAALVSSLGQLGNLLKMGYLFPMAIPVASVTVFWKLLFDEKGILNQGMELFHLAQRDWMNTDAAFWILVGSYIWKNIGYDMVLWIAALAAIPREQYEAAEVSGAGKWQCFRYITLPQMKSGCFVIGVLSFVNAFKVFREAYLIAGDYPHNSIYMLQHLFNNWFTRLDMQKMSAAAVVTAALISLFLIVVETVNERQEESE